MTDYFYAPLHGWLVMLAEGWRFANMVVEPMAGAHGRFAVLMERPVGAGS